VKQEETGEGGKGEQRAKEDWLCDCSGEGRKTHTSRFSRVIVVVVVVAAVVVIAERNRERYRETERDAPPRSAHTIHTHTHSHGGTHTEKGGRR
jgi:hypothetical protein